MRLPWLGEDFALVQKDKLYRCLDRLLAHKPAFFSFLKQRWETLFKPRFDVWLYDLTSTYFESDPPGAGKRQYGYSRDKRPDCVQVVIALMATPEGFPLAYEVMPGNTSDKGSLLALHEHDLLDTSIIHGDCWRQRSSKVPERRDWRGPSSKNGK